VATARQSGAHAARRFAPGEQARDLPGAPSRLREVATAASPVLIAARRFAPGEQARDLPGAPSRLREVATAASPVHQSLPSGFLLGLLRPILGDGFYPEHVGHDYTTLIDEGSRRLSAFVSGLSLRTALLVILASFSALAWLISTAPSFMGWS
jgi:hypothetical protein